MKKLLTILLALLVLCGCANKGYSQLSNGSDVLYTSPNGDYTRNDLYKSLKISSQTAVETDLTYKVAELENIDTTAIEQETEDLISMYQQMNAEYYIIYQYGSLDAFRKAYIADGIANQLAKAYVETKLDETLEEDKPVKMKVAFFDDEQTAAKVIDEVNNGETFETAALNNGYGNDIVDQVYLDTSSTLDLYIKQYLNETTNTGISTVITSVNTTTDTDGNTVNKSTYYVLDITSRNIDDFKDEYVELKVDATESKDVMNYFYGKHDIEFYDQDIYEMMKAEYEVLQ